MSKTVITIARGFGSGGRTVGKLLAKKLNLDFYDNELLASATVPCLPFSSGTVLLTGECRREKGCDLLFLP